MKIETNPNLKDKVVVITGGAGVLGSAFTLAVAKAGAKVVIIGRNEQKAQKFADELMQKGYQAMGVAANVLDIQSLEEAHQKVLHTFGKTNILINCAGGNDPKATTQDEYFNLNNYETKSTRGFFDLDLNAFNDVFGLNFTGTLLPTQVFAKDMIGSDHPTIVNISSMSAFNPLTKIPAYAAAKAAINNFTQWLAVHFASSGIRVNAIAPGFFSTEQNATLLWNPDGTPTPRTKKIISQTPMGRFGEAHELMGTLLWLLDHEASGFVTGVVVPVDGGFSAYSGV
jgi:NAD(P)-dependent dehydrogenase (short-subunit alcohol dehydrogenase family)